MFALWIDLTLVRAWRFGGKETCLAVISPKFGPALHENR